MKTRALAARTVFVVAVSALGAMPVSAQTDANTARYVAANCANCHGTKGEAKDAMPSIAGQKREYIAAQMRAFRDGKRPSTLMHQIAKGYTDAQIDAIADFFARQ